MMTTRRTTTMNSRPTKNNGADTIPAPTALAGAEVTLQRFDALASAMIATGEAIPKALAAEREVRSSLGGAEIDGGDVAELRQRLASVISERESQARRRAAATEALLKFEPELNRARSAVDQARAELAASVVSQFSTRWDAACRALLELRAEAEALGKALGVAVHAALPFTTRLSPVTGNPEMRLITPTEPILPAALPPALVSISDVAAKLDSALALVASVRQGRELTSRYYALARQRGGTQTETGGVFQVERPFTALGSSFAVHQLLDASLLPVGLLERFWKGRSIRPLEGATVAA
jgi:hypothetical protein